MQEIKCPKCGEVFQVDESGYAAIVKQVRDKEFKKEIEQREKTFQAEKDLAIGVAVKKTEEEKDKLIAKLNDALHTGKSRYELELSEKNHEIEQLKEKNKADEANAKLRIETIENTRNVEIEIAVEKIRNEKDTEIERLKAQIKNNDSEKQMALQEADSQHRVKMSEKEVEIELLKNQIEINKSEAKHAVESAIQESEKQIAELKGEIDKERWTARVRAQEVEEKHKIELRMKDEQIEQYRDFKAKQSTKMIGESLEQHCLTEFNKIRALAFQRATFEKDNDARTGSKGDFIYRELSEDNVEFISIMFEMKNEMDTTITKHKNEDFFKELDKDRREKGCEYAVLVSLLESDSELYNGGIVDVSHRYEKMYVIRPQFFIPMITLLRNAALNSLEYRRKLELANRQNIDVTTFEQEMEDFKKKFGFNYSNAQKKFLEAIEEIDKSIAHLNRIKEALTKSENHLRLANDKAQDLSIKKLTRNNPTMQEKFAQVRSAQEAQALEE